MFRIYKQHFCQKCALNKIGARISLLYIFLLEVLKTRGFQNMLFSHWPTENLLISYWLKNSRFSKLQVLETLVFEYARFSKTIGFSETQGFSKLQV